MSVAASEIGRAAAGRPPGDAKGPLAVTGIRKRFGEATALAGVDLEVRRGAIVGLVGPNGSGKTTLLHAVAGLLAIDGGSITVGGARAGSSEARAATVLVPDEPAGFDELTVAELVSLAHALWRADGRAGARAATLMTAFGLGARRDQRLGSLSRGLRRQASAVAALSLAPPLILVDEATATLDPEAVVVLDEALSALAARGCGILLATQDLHFAEVACDEVVLLHRGSVIERGTPEVLRARHEAASLEEAFLGALGDSLLRERIRDAFESL